ncbi:E3 ubiquitin-protein ligase hyd [Boleophthalmus pectinirostris]|uniref:E3 ubiquitin-protein ligase hyd n=1 Tax=Boleophthalmus pectinirostris TaxID=150288 RepID=UPI000A1C4891|nr:E3 ubiquitin-protein ligase hyd [Boleophthalmus pectinirostris]XP_020777565.1 E3 ubiquitin-protein ligase hyd [Boleophthalmus pectinirostris]XP_055007277.1 E3 ubiquitin-protein ligase hyd [Boleophthalmus pectinirostris]
MNDEENVEKLGEELYSRIYKQHKDTAGKLTGMLLELPFAVLVQLLQDEAMLTAAVDKAFKALQEATKPSQIKLIVEDDLSTSSDSLGEQLFELVELYNTGYSQKITGMLLEQQKDVVVSLLSNPSLLEEQVNQALETLKKETVRGLNDSLDVEDPEEFGERLYSAVQKINQDHANDITGMLLEMDHTALHQLLCDNMLEAAVQKALSALGINSTEHK